MLPKKSQKIWEDHEKAAVEGCNGVLGYFYLLYSPDRKCYQLGITTDPNKRVNIHRNNGWEVLRVLGPSCYNCVKRMEIDCIHALNSFQIPIGKRAAKQQFDEQFDGWTETWKAEHFAPENDAMFFWKIQIDPKKYGLYTLKEREYQNKLPNICLDIVNSIGFLNETNK